MRFHDLDGLRRAPIADVDATNQLLRPRDELLHLRITPTAE
jgi:hypothetical protein